MERTFIIIKPEAVVRGLVGIVLQRFEQRGLKIVALEVRTVDRDVAARHYTHLQGQSFFEGVLDAITAGPVVVGVLEGPDAIRVVRNLIGPTDPMKAPAGTIRGDFGTCLPYNVVHASDSEESFKREMELFFGKKTRSGKVVE